MFDVAPIGETREVIEDVHAISPERRIRNPAVAAISEAARTRLLSRELSAPWFGLGIALAAVARRRRPHR